MPEAPAVAPLPRPMAYRRVVAVRTKFGDNDGWHRVGERGLCADGSGGAQDASVFVVPQQPIARPWLGFGGSFTEAATETLHKMSDARRAEVVAACYDKEAGLAYNMGRVHIGSCDFSLGNWTCGELADGDHQLQGFSLERYQASILPTLRSAVAVACEPITLLASPWSPPTWMKTKKEFHGDGHLRRDCYDAWALHYVRFVQEMEKEGIPIWAISVQNEPEAAQIWESCIYSAEEERDFVRDHLGPTMEAAGLSRVKIVIWDHNRDGMFERAVVAYSDEKAAKYIWGLGYHWYGDARFETWPERYEVEYEDRQKDADLIYEVRARLGLDNVRRVAEFRPDKHILFTEGCQELSGRDLQDVLDSNQQAWKLGERYAMNIISDLNNGCEGWIDWNLCLDETGGPNHVGNLCCAPIICDTQKDQVLKLPAYWYLGHFSRYMKPGACRLLSSSSRDILEVTSWINPDGSLVVIVLNQSEEEVYFWLKVFGFGAVQFRVALRSITTFLVDDVEPEGSVSGDSDASEQN